jgi:hypothetical protein
MAEEHASYDALVDLALDDPEDRSAGERDVGLLQHLARCGPCRSRYGDVVATIEQVLPATPRIDPPPGFDRAVLTAMGMGADQLESPRAGAGTRWRRGSLVAAAAALGVLLGVGGTLAWTALDDPADRPRSTVAASLDTPAGDAVGAVTRSYLEGEPVMVVRVDDGVVGVEYECVLVLDDGRTRPVGSWVMESPEATWVVPVPPSGVDAVRLVTGEGRLWSAADLDRVGG